MIAGTTGLFAHASNPLTHTMQYSGDPGLFGPGSMTWAVLGDPAAFIGGIRALLVQAAHPEVAAGVVDHSIYKTDPLGRLSRTSNYVTATGFGAMPEVEAAVAVVARAHRPVHGVSSRGRSYSASRSDLAAWVHNALSDSFLAAYQHFGPRPLTEQEADRYVAEQARLGRLMRVDETPETARELRAWLAEHPDVAPSPGADAAMGFLRFPPLPRATLPAYHVFLRAAAATLPVRIRHAINLPSRTGAIAAGRAATRLFRWGLGASPAWHAALLRTGAPVPEGLFRQPPSFLRGRQ